MADTWSDEDKGPPGSANPGDDSRVECSPRRVPYKLPLCLARKTIFPHPRGGRRPPVHGEPGEGFALLGQGW